MERAKLSQAVKNSESGEDTPNYSRSQQTQQKYEARIDALFNGAKANRDGVRVLDSSNMLQLLKYSNSPVVLKEAKVIQGLSNHPFMSAKVWKSVPQWLDNPAAVFDSDTVPGALVFIAPEMVANAPVRITVEPESNVNNVNVHLLTNSYDAHGKAPWMRWAHSGLGRYVDRKKFPSILAPSGLQLPRVEQVMMGTRKILTEKI